MKKKTFLLLLFLISSITHAQESYQLRAGESISSLLYERLQIRPSTVSDIDRTLIYNNISPDDVRSLKVGTKIKIPPEILKKSQLASVTQKVETKQSAPLLQTERTTELNKNLYKGLGIIFERMRSVGDQVENVYLTALRPSFFILPTLQNEENFLQARLEGSILFLQKDIKREGAASFLLGEGSLEYLRSIKKFDIGFKTRISKQVLLLPFVDSYEVFTEWLWGYGPVLQWKRWGFQHMFIPDQGDGVRETQSNFETSLSYNFQYNEREFQARAFYGNTSIEAVDTREFGLVFEYFF